MKIGLLKETKTPVDNRVALAPEQVAQLNKEYTDSEIVVQSSDIRAYTDDEYRNAGVKVVDDVSDCDVLLGINEVSINTLIPNKHYVFFGHFAKMQEKNRSLLQAMLEKGITFSDYEYMVNRRGVRVCGFGWWAGIVGVYYTLRGYGLKTNTFELPVPGIRFTLHQLIANLKAIDLPKVKLLVTGAGQVSEGVQFILSQIGAKRVGEDLYLTEDNVEALTFCVADVDQLVHRKDGGFFNLKHFIQNPKEYESDFMLWAKQTDILICAHYWSPGAPVYLTEDDLRSNENRIRMIGDITCDIKGSVKSTIRPATHENPYYDYNPLTEKEEPLFNQKDNITIEAVETCSNALPMDASKYFGDMIIPYVMRPLLEGRGDESFVINSSTILKDGKLTADFAYLSDFAKD